MFAEKRIINLLWPRKGSPKKTQTRILDNRLYYTRKIELHEKGKKSRTVRITPIVICPYGSEISVLITVRRVHYRKMGKVPASPLCEAFYFVKVLLIFFFFLGQSSMGRWISFSSLTDVFQVLVREDLNRTFRKWCPLALPLFVVRRWSRSNGVSVTSSGVSYVCIWVLLQCKPYHQFLKIIPRSQQDVLVWCFFNRLTCLVLWQLYIYERLCLTCPRFLYVWFCFYLFFCFYTVSPYVRIYRSFEIFFFVQ